jgi:predicted O-methyltransferase YrrM
MRRLHAANDTQTPIVLISSCAGKDEPGDFRFNGGVKLYNLWAKILRREGIPAFIVTYDGKRLEWLERPQPVVSLETAAAWKASGLPLLFLTAWLGAKAFLDVADEFYYYDCESNYTFGLHRRVFRRLLKRGKICGIATHSRTQQARHMEFHGRDVMFIPIWSDSEIWFDDSAVREKNLIGFTEESDESVLEAEIVVERCTQAGLPVRAVRICGFEREMAETLRECDLFLGLNHGKDPLWGEGSPLTQQEAMHSGCVVAAYDVRGNREYLVEGFTGRLVPPGDISALSDAVVDTLARPEVKERLRRESRALVSSAFVEKSRLGALPAFLGITTAPAPVRSHAPERSTLERLLGADVYMAEEEIPVFAEIARKSKGRCVEIGAAFGGSTALLLLNLPPGSELHSVDPFVTDSMVDFRASADVCVRNVVRAVGSVGASEAIVHWELHVAPSLEVAERWHGSLALLYIDGDHTYEAVAADFRAWLPFVSPGGTIILHDSRRLPGAPEREFARGWPGPTRVANELRSHACVKLSDEVFSMTVWTRTSSDCPQCTSGWGSSR